MGGLAASTLQVSFSVVLSEEKHVEYTGIVICLMKDLWVSVLCLVDTCIVMLKCIAQQDARSAGLKKTGIELPFTSFPLSLYHLMSFLFLT
jgi:hypothetical protein